jgi:hypothetical protein
VGRGRAGNRVNLGIRQDTTTKTMDMIQGIASRWRGTLRGSTRGGKHVSMVTHVSVVIQSNLHHYKHGRGPMSTVEERVGQNKQQQHRQ